MKKIIALLLALTMVFALAACGGKEGPSNNQNTSETQNTSNGAQENEDNTSAETNEKR